MAQRFLFTVIAAGCLGTALAGQYPEFSRLAKNGGRVDWYKGPGHELIAFDAVVDPETKNSHVFTMLPDGLEKTCVSCDSDIPEGFVGQPAWHPDGQHLILQSENANSSHSPFEHPMWGINNDLWLIRSDGTEAERIYESPHNHGILHPHFNQEGTKLVFAERIATGEIHPELEGITPGGEDPWSGWRIHLADFDPAAPGPEKLSRHQILFPQLQGFVETHGFHPDGHIVFAYTPEGQSYVDDLYVGTADGLHLRRITNSPTSWEEHGRFSPSGSSFAFVSSLVDDTWVFPGSRFDTLKTELYIANLHDGSVRRATYMNGGTQPGRRIVTDFSWDSTGTRIVCQVWFLDENGSLTSMEDWLVTLPEP